jgi:aldehyde dehydrogenase (NAD+)
VQSGDVFARSEAVSGKEALPRLPRGYKLKNTCAGPTVAESGACVKRAVFGPILPILTYKSLDEAFARIAAAPRPLAGFIFSRDQKTIDRFTGELSYGGGRVNLVNVHLFVETMPFGGAGSAGMGHYYGRYGFDALTHAKSMLISPPDVAIDHLYSPFTDEKNKAL